MVSLSLCKQRFIIFVWLVFILQILNSCSIFVTVCTFAQFWGMFHEENYRINLFVQNIWIANFQCNEFVETSCTSLFFESFWSEQDSCTPIFSVYMTLAQRTREDVKYFKVKLYIFFCNYLEYHLVSWGSNLRNLLAKYFHLPPLLSFGTNYSRMYQNLLSPLLNTLSNSPMPQRYWNIMAGRWYYRDVLLARRQSETFSIHCIK